MIVVDSHYKVLTSWAEYRRTLKSAPRLLTLDHHTDTSKPFRNFIAKTIGLDKSQVENIRSTFLSELNYNDSKSLALAMSRLSNDEHIVTAIKTDIISAALVIAHNAYDTDINTYNEHKIICRAVDRKPNSEKLERSDYDAVLETSFLEPLIESFNMILNEASEASLEDLPYILDIDLDYFNTADSIKPINVSAFKNLAKNAGLITIATEPEYVKHCALDPEISSSTLLSALTKII